MGASCCGQREVFPASPLLLASYPCPRPQAFWSVSTFPREIWPQGEKQHFATTTWQPRETALGKLDKPCYTHWDPFRQEAACALAEPGCDGMEGGLGKLGPAERLSGGILVALLGWSCMVPRDGDHEAHIGFLNPKVMIFFEEGQ